MYEIAESQKARVKRELGNSTFLSFITDVEIFLNHLEKPTLWWQNC